MTLITQKDRVRVAEAIAAAERRTNAEIVTVLAAASDDYLHVGLMWVALLTLAVSAIAILAGWNPLWIVLTQLVGIYVMVAVFRFSKMAVRFAPVALRRRRAEDLARRQFLEQRLHHTAAQTGFMIFVSEAEHYVEIIADRGIARQVDDGRWQQIIETFVIDVRRGQAVAGLVKAIEHCAEILEQVVPKTDDNRNELDDRLVLIGYPPVS